MNPTIKHLIDDNECSPKFLAFVDALAQLCLDHGVVLSVSGDDALQVWDDPIDSPPIHCTGIENCMRAQGK